MNEDDWEYDFDRYEHTGKRVLVHSQTGQVIKVGTRLTIIKKPTNKRGPAHKTLKLGETYRVAEVFSDPIVSLKEDALEFLVDLDCLDFEVKPLTEEELHQVLRSLGVTDAQEA